MKTIPFENPYVNADSLSYVIEYFLDFSKGDHITSKAGEWMGMYYSLLIITGRNDHEETILFLQDLLRHTLMDHRKRDYKTHFHAIHNSIANNYCGTTVIHDTLDDAIDYANYMRIRINN